MVEYQDMNTRKAYSRSYGKVSEERRENEKAQMLLQESGIVSYLKRLRCDCYLVRTALLRTSRDFRSMKKDLAKKISSLIYHSCRHQTPSSRLWDALPRRNAGSRLPGVCIVLFARRITVGFLLPLVPSPTLEEMRERWVLWISKCLS